MTLGSIELELPAAKPALRGELRALAVVTIASMIGFRLLVSLYDLLHEDFRLYLVLPFEIAVFASAALLCSGFYLMLRRVHGSSLFIQLSIAAGMSMFASTLLSAGIHLSCSLFMRVCPPFNGDFLLTHALTFFPPFAIWAALALTISFYRQTRERERKLAFLQMQARDADMQALRYQVNPHLVYDTLDAIGDLIRQRKNGLAEEMVVRLSGFFRASLASDPRSDVPLADEVTLQRLHLAIEEMRFPDRLRSHFDIPHELEKVRVPSLILQPLIDNAINHATRAEASPTTIQIRARQSGRQLILEISDDGPLPSFTSESEIGLTELRERLKARFAGDADIEVESHAVRGSTVRLTMPARG